MQEKSIVNQLSLCSVTCPDEISDIVRELSKSMALLGGDALAPTQHCSR